MTQRNGIPKRNYGDVPWFIVPTVPPPGISLHQRKPCALHSGAPASGRGRERRALWLGLDAGWRPGAKGRTPHRLPRPGASLPLLTDTLPGATGGQCLGHPVLGLGAQGVTQTQQLLGVATVCPHPVGVCMVREDLAALGRAPCRRADVASSSPIDLGLGDVRGCGAFRCAMCTRRPHHPPWKEQCWRLLEPRTPTPPPPKQSPQQGRSCPVGHEVEDGRLLLSLRGPRFVTQH